VLAREADGILVIKAGCAVIMRIGYYPLQPLKTEIGKGIGSDIFFDLLD